MKRDELPIAKYVWVIDSQEIACICAYLGITQAVDLISAALVEVVDGAYGFVYFSEGSNFKRSGTWDWQAWHYYADHIPDELDLQGDDNVKDGEILEAIVYVDLFLDDLEADEPTIDQPVDLLNHIRKVLVESLPPHRQDTV